MPRGSAVTSVTGLRGRKVALNKGSNVHYLLVRALENAGVAYADIEPVFLAPADARAAFERGAIDAWVIWDPYQAAAEAATGARTLTDGTGLVANHQFYLAGRPFVADNPEIVDATLAEIDATDRWVEGNARAVAEALSPQTGIPPAVLEVALGRESFGVRPLDAAVVAEQQRIADTFFKLGLLPKAIAVARAVRKAAA